MKFDSLADHTKDPVTIKHSDRATYFELSYLPEEIDAVHFYEFPNDYEDNMLAENQRKI